LRLRVELRVLSELNVARRERRGVLLVTDMTSGAMRLVAEHAVANDPLAPALVAALRAGRSGLLDDGRTFVTVHAPPPRIVAIGAVHISQALAAMAATAGFTMTIIDPRTAFATDERFPEMELVAEWPEEALKGVPLDAYTALVALSHDPKIDDLPLARALAAGCFYVGALGSRKTHERRLERLRREGISAADLDRIHAPIGLEIGAQSPAEIAVAILAEIIRALRLRPDAARAAA
jgi:xanthine dehydrogenase accessory factor